MKDNKSIHDGHRQRLKNKFIENGFQGFEPHNVLELLLFYSIPRKDTNELAHNLINHFGSLKKVFEADYVDLLKVDGIKENSATLIKMVPKIAQEYVDNDIMSSPVFDTANKIGEYFVNKYMGAKNEIVYAMLLNNRYELLSVELIHEGSVNSATLSLRKILDAVVKHNAAMLILAHNHPEGIACPSMVDMETTANLMTAFQSFGINLVEHFVVAGKEYCPIVRHTRSVNPNISTKNNVIKETIDLKF